MEGDKLFYSVWTKLTVLTFENGSGDEKKVEGFKIFVADVKL